MARARDMYAIGEMWSLPWHELQRDLALGLGFEPAGRSADVRAQSVAFSANSWLARAHNRLVPAPELRR